MQSIFKTQDRVNSPAEQLLITIWIYNPYQKTPRKSLLDLTLFLKQHMPHVALPSCSAPEHNLLQTTRKDEAYLVSTQ